MLDQEYKTKSSPEQIRTAVSRFLFSVEIQSLKSIALTGDWPLDSAPARSARFDRANHELHQKLMSGLFVFTDFLGFH
jgi:hypothetical protein